MHKREPETPIHKCQLQFFRSLSFILSFLLNRDRRENIYEHLDSFRKRDDRVALDISLLISVECSLCQEAPLMNACEFVHSYLLSIIEVEREVERNEYLPLLIEEQRNFYIKKERRTTRIYHCSVFMTWRNQTMFSLGQRCLPSLMSGG